MPSAREAERRSTVPPIGMQRRGRAKNSTADTERKHTGPTRYHPGHAPPARRGGLGTGDVGRLGAPWRVRHTAEPPSIEEKDHASKIRQHGTEYGRDADHGCNLGPGGRWRHQGGRRQTTAAEAITEAMAARGAVSDRRHACRRGIAERAASRRQQRPKGLRARPCWQCLVQG
jgi:hypothetical protein